MHGLLCHIYTVVGRLVDDGGEDLVGVGVDELEAGEVLVEPGGDPPKLRWKPRRRLLVLVALAGVVAVADALGGGPPGVTRGEPSCRRGVRRGWRTRRAGPRLRTGRMPLPGLADSRLKSLVPMLQM